jgi:hypothetical protein
MCICRRAHLAADSGAIGPVSLQADIDRVIREEARQTPTREPRNHMAAVLQPGDNRANLRAGGGRVYEDFSC